MEDGAAVLRVDNASAVHVKVEHPQDQHQEYGEEDFQEDSQAFFLTQYDYDPEGETQDPSSDAYKYAGLRYTAGPTPEFN